MLPCVFPCACEDGGPRHHRAHDNSLEIRNVTRKSAGVYTVKCTNEEGENQTTIRLNVQCETQTHTHTLNVVSSCWVCFTRDLWGKRHIIITEARMHCNGTSADVLARLRHPVRSSCGKIAPCVGNMMLLIHCTYLVILFIIKLKIINNSEHFYLYIVSVMVFFFCKSILLKLVDLLFTLMLLYFS